MASNLKTPAKPTKSGTVSKVRVVVRVRPFLTHEILSNKGGPTPVVSAQFESPNEVSVHLKDQETSRQECYKLDGFFGPDDNNVAKIFEQEVKPLIPGVFRGSNATVFAYGATGSGKTYTMQGTDEQLGMMPLAMSSILSLCQSTGCIAELSFYEVYLDKCYDLLDVKANAIPVLDDKEGRIHLKGLSKVAVNSMSQFHEIFALGALRRKVAHTDLNDVSSRSHGVLVITLSKSFEGGSAEITTIGKLNLIDLAGNEDNRRSGNEGIRMVESAKINQSLLALSNVIYALNNNKAWVPYRESKLTRILQDSLGGTNHALMVACLSPGDYQESIHTVSLAARSRKISNVVPSAQKQGTPKVRIDMEEKLRTWFESKGKTNGTQRMGAFAFGSPLFPQTPGSVRSMTKQAARHGSVSTKAANRGTAILKDRFTSVPQRKLFDTEAASVSGNDNDTLQEFKDIKDCPSSTSEVLMVPEDECLKGNSSLSANLYDSHHCSNENGTLQEFKDIKKDCPSSTSELLMVLEDECLKGNLSANLYDSHHCSNEVHEADTKAVINECNVDRTTMQSTSCLPDNLLSINDRVDSIHQYLPNKPKVKSCHSPLRTPLSSVIPNIQIEEISSKENVRSELAESQTPVTPFVVTRQKFEDFDNPLDKFSTRTSNLKSFLVEEYIDFLNTATREELVKLKGIGVKRAEYIIELRQTSPLKSLGDLEKIGLTSKQALHMFTKAAKGIFDA